GRPAPALLQRAEDEERARLDALAAGLDDAARRSLAEEARALRAAQEAPDPPEAIAALPRLEVADIPRAARSIPTEARRTGGAQMLEHPVFSNGIGYVGLAFDAGDVGEDDIPYLPLVGRATTGMGAAGLDYAATATRI